MALPGSASDVIINVTTQGIGFAPILRHYFEKCDIAGIIDRNVTTDTRRKVLTHGQAAVAMITGILFQIMQLYRICQFARQSTVLDVIFPWIKPEEYFDDRLADTLDALYNYGLGNLELELTKHMIETFQIQNDTCHNDTTSASYYGAAGHNRSKDSIQITFGHSKKHRDDLKQLIWSMSVSSDSGFPLFQQPYSGNTADVNTYVEQWFKLIELLGRIDFLYVADCKLISKENIAVLCENGGSFLAPAPMYESYSQVFKTALLEHDRELLIPYKEKLNRGFEVPMPVIYEGKRYDLRMIILFDHGVGSIKRQGLESRVAKTRADFAQLESQINHRKLKTREAIENACTGIMKKQHTGEFFTCEITNTPVTTYHNKRRGRQSKNKPIEKIEVQTDHFHIELSFDSQAFDTALSQCGYYPLLTNRSSELLSIEQAMLDHKAQYKNEHTFRRSKGTYDLEPIYLHYPERIEAYLFLFKIALQIVVLIERTAKRNIQDRDRGLDDFMPNRKDVRNPRAEYLLSTFQYIVKGLMPTTADGRTYGFVSELNGLQLDILSVLEVPASCFSFQYLSNTS
jgi:transposase